MKLQIQHTFWGQVNLYATYKARRCGKLVIEVPAAYSSQECNSCGYIHSDNRVTQALFVCQRCQHTDHADHHAGKVISARGVKQLLHAKYATPCAKKEKKRCGILRNKVGAEGAEPIAMPAARRLTLGETKISREDGNVFALWSVNRETPTTTLLGV